MTVTQVRKDSCEVPSSLFRLTPLKIKEFKTQKDVAEAYINLYGVYRECVSKVNSIEKIFKTGK